MAHDGHVHDGHVHGEHEHGHSDDGHHPQGHHHGHHHHGPPSGARAELRPELPANAGRGKILFFDAPSGLAT